MSIASGVDYRNYEIIKLTKLDIVEKQYYRKLDFIIKLSKCNRIVKGKTIIHIINFMNLS